MALYHHGEGGGSDRDSPCQSQRGLLGFSGKMRTWTLCLSGQVAPFIPRLTRRPVSEQGFDQAWLRNAVYEPLEEANVIENDAEA